uniref:thioredoxin-disulfide reductase (NADPH) n=1 Tax=Trichuris muris TaxID=70415 RepID=A0A5S6R1Y1_TRIMR
MEEGPHKRESVVKSLLHYSGRDQLPLVFVKGDCVGCACDLADLNKRGLLKECLEEHKYDIVVVGGGSGGLAAAKEAALFGKRVAVLDYVVPSPVGTSWGLGGTCVNVGCIPKKLMHRAAIMGHCIEDAKQFGWQVEDKPRHDWKSMRDAVQGHIMSLNWGHKVALREKQVTYLNAFGTFVGSHSLKAVDKRGKEQILTSDRFLIATGLRPRYLDIPGAKEYCITSDDIFSLDYCPGKTLCVGASYVSLECAGFLRGIGLEVTVMVRSILLRGFDQDMANRIGIHMESVAGIKFIHNCVPTKIERIEEGKPGLLRVVGQTSDGQTIEGTYNTVLLAIGRDALTDGLNLDMLGVKRNEKNKKVICRPNEQSVSVPYVYAIGDVLDGGLELTPVAIKAGKLLARRLFGASIHLCEYENVPTTVFTPLEYGSCGMAEEKAIEKYGKENVEVFHAFFTPLEFTVPKRVDSDHCYAKVVCNKLDMMRVLGFHVLGPDAGEITQGFGIALKLKATKQDFDLLVGIHPTCAEIFTSLVVTKSSQEELKKGRSQLWNLSSRYMVCILFTVLRVRAKVMEIRANLFGHHGKKLSRVLESASVAKSTMSFGAVSFTLAVAAGGAYTLYYCLSSLMHSRKYYWLRNKVVLITGASSGLGESLARQFYLQGCKVILTARNVDKLQQVKTSITASDALRVPNTVQLHQPECYYVDLSNGDTIEKLVDDILEKHQKVDILINNAGVSIRATALSTTMHVHRQLMEVNYFGHVHLTHSFLHRKVELKSIVCISSVQSLISIPDRSAYAASKHAFHAYFDCLRAELGDQGVQVLVVCPAYVRTRLSLNALDGQGRNHGQMDTATLHGMDPDRAAIQVLKAVVDNEEELILAPPRIRLAILLRVIWPSLFFWLMRRRAAEAKAKLEQQAL